MSVFITQIVLTLYDCDENGWLREGRSGGKWPSVEEQQCSGCQGWRTAALFIALPPELDPHTACKEGEGAAPTRGDRDHHGGGCGKPGTSTPTRQHRKALDRSCRLPTGKGRSACPSRSPELLLVWAVALTDVDLPSHLWCTLRAFGALNGTLLLHWLSWGLDAKYIPLLKFQTLPKLNRCRGVAEVTFLTIEVTQKPTGS